MRELQTIWRGSGLNAQLEGLRSATRWIWRHACNKGPSADRSPSARGPRRPLFLPRPL